MTSVLISDRRGEDTDGRQGEGHVKIEAESGVMQTHAREHQELKKTKKAKKNSSLEALEGVLDVWLPEP